jgi:N-acetylglucosaminyl-diphospho-decaprenol L-rhamnosyltransferase
VDPETSELAVLTVTRSPGEALDRFLDSVKAAATRPVRVLVVDTGSTDGAPERAAGRDGVAVLRIGEDVGRAAAANRGIAELGQHVSWVAVADPHVEWGDGALDELLAAAARRPRAGALGPLVRAADGARLPSAWHLPATRPGPALLDALRGRAPAPPEDGEGLVGWLSGSCLLLRRAAWESVDGFDPRYAAGADDVDLGDRLARAGWLCVHVPSAEVVLTSGATGPGTAEGWRRYLADYLADRQPAPVLAALRVASWLHK